MAVEHCGWRPIGLVDKQASPVDLWHRDGFRVPDCRWAEGVKRHLGRIETGWADPNSGRIIPAGEITHWMPPPAGPDAAPAPLPAETALSADLTADLWNVVKEMRDEAMSLGRDRLDAQLSILLRRMQAEGMAAHLPTIEEMRGVLAHG